MKPKTFTEQEIKNWQAYEIVRAEGSYNMFDPRARELTGLSKADFAYCMDNYSELRDAADNE
jgi:hypothetical protein